MTKLSSLNIEQIFHQDAQKIIEARNRAIVIHSTKDIKAAGNEVEHEVRQFLKNRMPSNFYVGHGHIVDCELKTSPQFDVLISDNSFIPILLRANDGTEYFPSESLYAIGEVKSSYSKSDKPIEKFCESLKLVKTEMKRENVINTAYDGEIKDDTLIRDMIFQKQNKVLNAIYSFMFFVNSDNFDFKEFQSCKSKYGNEYLPNCIILLDKGVIFYAELGAGGMSFERYPEYPRNKSNEWIFSPFGKTSEKSSSPGNHLSFLYYNLLAHMNASFLEPVNLMPYFKTMYVGSKSEMVKL